jgi:MFS family permease
MGWQAAFMSFGGVVFLTAGGGLTELGWRWPFTIYLFAILLVPLAMSSLFEPAKAAKDRGVKNGHEKLVGTPKRLLALIYGLTFCAMAIFYFIPMQIPFYLNEMLVAGPAVIGMAIAVATLFGMLSSLAYGRVRARIGYIPILGLTFSLMGTGFLLVGLGNGYLPVLAGLAISGLGSGLMFPNMNVWLTTEVPVAVRGRAVGGLTTAIFLGQFMSPIAGQPIVENFGLSTLFLGSGAVLLGFALLLALFRRPLLAFIRTVKPPTVVGTPVSTETVQREMPEYGHRD